MIRRSQGEKLIDELLTEPARFNGNELLKQYFAGFPIETLRPLLSSMDQQVRRVAVWILSELGHYGRSLVGSVVPLADDGDPQSRFYALDVLATCAIGDDAVKYVHVVRLLEDNHSYIRAHVMFLMSNADVSQLKAAALALGAGSALGELHKQGLAQLLATSPDVQEVSSLLISPAPLLRRYGAIAAWRSHDRFRDLISRIPATKDEDIKKFWELRMISKQQRNN